MTKWSWDELDPRVRGRLNTKYPNAPDIVQETITRLFILLHGGLKVEVSPEALALGIAENVQKETWRHERRFTGIVTEFAAVTPPPPLLVPSDQEIEKLKREVFSTTDRKLFDEYFRYNRNVHKRRERLAIKLGVSMNTLYQQMFRLKQRLSEEYRRSKKAEVRN